MPRSRPFSGTRYFLMACVAATHITLMSASALAAQQHSVFNLTLKELTEVKVASLFTEDELRVGSTVSKVTEEQWRTEGAEKTFDALLHIPGIYVSEYFHGQMIPSFRGYTGTEQYNSFLLLLDGLPLNSYSSAAGTYGTPNYALGNLESIEVIRGPGSSIYGADAFNGVVELNTWSSDEDTSQVWFESGTFGYHQANARVRHAFSDEVILTSMLSFSGVNDEEIPEKFHPSPGAPLTDARIKGEYDNITTTHKLAIRNLELALYYSRHDVEDSIGTGEVFPVFPNGSHSDGSAAMLAVKLAHIAEFDNGLELESSAYHIHSDLEGSFALANAGAPPKPPTLDWDSEDQRTGVNLIAKRLLNETDTRLVFGYNYDEIETDHLIINVAGSGAPPVAENKDRTLHGFMTQIEKCFFEDQLQIILGVRHDNYSDFGNHTSPRLAFIHHPTENTAIKLMYGNAYRAPSVNEQSDNGLVKGGGDSLSPEQVDTYELAWIQAADNWRYRISTYWSDTRDSITVSTSTDPDFQLEYQNNVNGESYGAEAEVVFKNSTWHCCANASWNRSKQTLTSEPADAYLAFPDLIINAGVAYSPENPLSISINNLIYDGFRSLNPGPAIAPSYVYKGDLPTFWRTDIHITWVPTSTDLDYQLYVTVLDVFDRQDIAASMNAIEDGFSSPGRKLVAGLSMEF